MNLLARAERRIEVEGVLGIGRLQRFGIRFDRGHQRDPLGFVVRGAVGVSIPTRERDDVLLAVIEWSDELECVNSTCASRAVVFIAGSNRAVIRHVRQGCDRNRLAPDGVVASDGLGNAVERRRGLRRCRGIDRTRWHGVSGGARFGGSRNRLDDPRLSVGAAEQAVRLDLDVIRDLRRRLGCRRFRSHRRVERREHVFGRLQVELAGLPWHRRVGRRRGDRFEVHVLHDDESIVVLERNQRRTHFVRGHLDRLVEDQIVGAAVVDLDFIVVLLRERLTCRALGGISRRTLRTKLASRRELGRLFLGGFRSKAACLLGFSLGRRGALLGTLRRFGAGPFGALLAFGALGLHAGLALLLGGFPTLRRFAGGTLGRLLCGKFSCGSLGDLALGGVLGRELGGTLRCVLAGHPRRFFGGLARVGLAGRTSRRLRRGVVASVTGPIGVRWRRSAAGLDLTPRFGRGVAGGLRGNFSCSSRGIFGVLSGRRRRRRDDRRRWRRIGDVHRRRRGHRRFNAPERTLRRNRRTPGERIGALRRNRRAPGERIGTLRRNRRAPRERIGTLLRYGRAPGERIGTLRRNRRAPRERIGTLLRYGRAPGERIGTGRRGAAVWIRTRWRRERASTTVPRCARRRGSTTSVRIRAPGRWGAKLLAARRGVRVRSGLRWARHSRRRPLHRVDHARGRSWKWSTHCAAVLRVHAGLRRVPLRLAVSRLLVLLIGGPDPALRGISTPSRRTLRRKSAAHRLLGPPITGLLLRRITGLLRRITGLLWRITGLLWRIARVLLLRRILPIGRILRVLLAPSLRRRVGISPRLRLLLRRHRPGGSAARRGVSAALRLDAAGDVEREFAELGVVRIARELHPE